MVSDRQYLEAVYDHAGGRTDVEIKSWDLLERVGLTKAEDMTKGHQTRLRLERAGLLAFVPNTAHGRLYLTEAGKAEVEHHKG